ncbi:MAG: GatB/YqeY domain-containing protein [Lachnospiraceae bacterium]|jgi:uncharacterized protein YqeY|nr:GatB/YqeY domain-containing protein [Lachnospiraceae bacterium]MEE3461028.1 GatB/YqeY domain-containing protein [Lachnospiraceae bacterium]
MEFKTLQKEMVAAMKAHDKARKEVISTLVSAAKKIAIDEGKRDNISEEIVGRAIAKELKTAKEELDTCPPERTDLIEKYQNAYNIITEFAPKQLSEDELREKISKDYADLIATKDRGKIMKTVMGDLRGSADGKLINKVVSDLLK